MDTSAYIAINTEIEKTFHSLFLTALRQIHGELRDDFDEKLTLSVDRQTKDALNNVLRNYGLDVYSIAVTIDGFEVTFNFEASHWQIDGFPYSSVSIRFEENCEFATQIYLDSPSDIDVWLHADGALMHRLSADEFQRLARDIANNLSFLSLKQR
jgi:hypothetical protein